MAFYFIYYNIRRYSMKYEIPVCEIIEFSVEDVITTSIPVSKDEKPVTGDTVIVDVNSDSGMGGGEST